MTVREWKYTDVNAIAEFEKKQMFPDSWNFSQLADSVLSDGFLGLLAEENGEIIATAAINFGLDEADLVNILVAARLRKRGVASQLLDALLCECRKRELKKLFLEVRESNIPAIKLYTKYGFVKISERKKYYGDGETAIVMVKDFDYGA